MQALLRAFWSICVLRRGPQDLPASTALFGLVLVVNTAVSTAVVASKVDWGRALYASAAEAIVMLGAVYALLAAVGHRARGLQTLTALTGTSLVINALALPLVWLSPLFSTLNNPFGLLLVILMLWSIVIVGHIMRHAFSVSMLTAGLLALGYALVNIELSYRLLGAEFS